MNKNIWQLFALSALIYFSQGLSGLPDSAFFFYLKETLGWNEQKIMYIGSIIGLAWLIKPCIGHIIDNWGIPKRTWILGSILASLICSLILGFLAALPIVVLTMMMLSCSNAVRDVAIDGLSCCEGKKNNITGKLQSLQWSAITIASILTGVVGGWLADHTTYQNCYLLLVPFYIIMLLMAWQYKENMSEITKNKTHFFGTMKELFKDKNLILVCLFLFLYKLSPSIGTPLAFIERDSFHWSRTFMGFLGTISAVASLGGAWLYYHYSTKLNIRSCLVWSVWLGALTSLAYLYFTPFTAVLYDIIFSVVGMFIMLMILDLMARESKSGYESISFALLCSISNLTGTINGFLGGFLLPIVSLQVLIIISAASSFLCLPLLKRIKV